MRRLRVGPLSLPVCFEISARLHSCRCCGRWFRARPLDERAVEWYCMLMSERCGSGWLLMGRVTRVPPDLYFEQLVIKRSPFIY